MKIPVIVFEAQPNLKSLLSQTQLGIIELTLDDTTLIEPWIVESAYSN